MRHHGKAEGQQVAQLSSCAVGSVELCERLVTAMVRSLNDGSKLLPFVSECLERLKRGDGAAGNEFLTPDQDQAAAHDENPGA